MEKYINLPLLINSSNVISLLNTFNWYAYVSLFTSTSSLNIVSSSCLGFTSLVTNEASSGWSSDNVIRYLKT